MLGMALLSLAKGQGHCRGGWQSISLLLRLTLDGVPAVGRRLDRGGFSVV